MTQMTPPPARPGRSGSETEPPFLSLHTTVVLLTALVLGLVVGGLAALTEVPRAAAVLVGLTAAGSTVPVLRSLIGQPRERSGL
ncbi:hypothetical protein M2163_000963 [Streptomyces sp. SAI-135]|uniref:hypothetical protein n=1 Tax=unclassified Streptomyces TaxID=2593676 RepID=UPI00247610FD|nr:MULTISPECIES: hypothetical protein [unclassified Streptomyces]MDH6522527.1 hypothetical protein [Streptomyces sp. SAI-090]MDH6554148.1 hypothetical protein [Streptomyces sp. SAI-041]MDH6573412.1 hypothetical protein [Streptomyces sp. SAI-117]MDH6581834.1 hypothetical protein [Streptomyces sp. SAI-133]MDH6590106.1 hypothetical protein [Streptomyces sp. SAI-133]